MIAAPAWSGTTVCGDNVVIVQVTVQWLWVIRVNSRKPASILKPARRLSSLVKLSDDIYLMQLNSLAKKIQTHTIYIYIP